MSTFEQDLDLAIALSLSSAAEANSYIPNRSTTNIYTSSPPRPSLSVQGTIPSPNNYPTIPPYPNPRPLVSSSYSPVSRTREEEDLALAIELSKETERKSSKRSTNLSTNKLPTAPKVNQALTNDDEALAIALARSLETDSSTRAHPPLPPSSPASKSSARAASNLFSDMSKYLGNSMANSLGGMKCSVCHSYIMGSYVTISDKICHPSCLVCSGCNLAINGQVVVKDEGYYHPRCSDELFTPNCTLCSKKLHGTFYRNASPLFQDEIYCVEHINSRICFSCNRKEPSPSSRREGFTDLPDGRCFCSDCIATAILDSSEAKPLYLEVVNFMESVLKMRIPDGMREVPVLAVDSPSLNENLSSNNKTSSHHTAQLVRGLTLSSIGQIKHMTPGTVTRDAYTGRYISSTAPQVYKIEDIREVTAVLVLYGLPRELTASILAHEAMHVWIRLQKSMPFYLPPKVEEGLCQVVAFKYLEHNGARHGLSSAASMDIQEKLRNYFALSIENDKDPVYGDGFREGRASVDTLSLDVVLEYVRDNKSFPNV